MTQIQIARRGNSVAVRLPEAVLDQLGLKPGECVEPTVENGKGIIEPSRPKKITLEWIIAETKRLGPENAPETVEWDQIAGTRSSTTSFRAARQRSMTSLQADDIVWVLFDPVISNADIFRLSCRPTLSSPCSSTPS